MRTYPETEDDKKDLEVLNAKPWQLELLKLNPDYVFWGNHEDYMSDKDSGWRSAVSVPTWSEHTFELDSYNEVVNFYFEIYRKNHECPHCHGSNLNKATQKLSDEWYSFDNPRYVYLNENRRYNDNAWSHHLTEVEVEALAKHGRLSDLMPDNKWTRFDDETNTWKNMDMSLPFAQREWVECEAPTMPTPEAVNAWSLQGMGHDSINQWICVEARAKHLGVYGHCGHCTEGYIYDELEAKVSLQLWVLHPRKGCSRGVLIEEIQQDDLPSVYAYLREAANRNQERFSKIMTVE